MTRKDFIKAYGISEKYKTHFGYQIENKKVFAVPCNCDAENCEGWGMVSEENLADHFQLYYWPDQ